LHLALRQKKSQHFHATSCNKPHQTQHFTAYTAGYKQFRLDCKIKPTGVYVMKKFQSPNSLKVRKALIDNHNQSALKVRNALGGYHSQSVLKVRKSLTKNHNQTGLILK